MLRSVAVGSSALVGLPLLDAMLNDHGTALAHGGDLPVRFMSYYWADGVVLGQWEPIGVGADWQLNTAMEPLAAVKDYLNVCTGIRNRAPVQVTHHEGMTAFNGYGFVEAGGLDTNAGGPTVDQVIADVLEEETLVRGVHVRVSKRESTDGDGGTTVLAMSHRDVSGNLVPQIPQANPQEVWQQLFGEFVPKPDDSALRTSILDYVRDDANRVKEQVGMVDRQRIDAHLQGVFELEQKIVATPPPCDIPEQPTETNTDMGGTEPITAVNLAMGQLIAYAFTCDITRVASFLLKKFVSSTVFDEIGAQEIHHNASHQGPGNATYQAGVTYQMQRFADLLEIFQNTPDGDGNLLDSMIVYASSDCSTGQSHSISRQPIILAGHGRGYLQYPGIHYQTEPFNDNDNNPNSSGNMSDVLLTCLQAFDPEASSIGGGAPMSNTPLEDVKA